jgi:hypothetical protein
MASAGGNGPLQQIHGAGCCLPHGLLTGGKVVQHRRVGVGNFRRQCLPGFSKPLPRQRARVRLLMPKCLRASRAVAQGWRCWLSIASVEVAPWNRVGGGVHPTSWLEKRTTGYPDQPTRPDRAGRPWPGQVHAQPEHPGPFPEGLCAHLAHKAEKGHKKRVPRKPEKPCGD